MIRFLLIAGVLSVPSLASAQDQALAELAGLRLAYFSPERAFMMSPDGKSAQAKLTALEAERGKELAARNAKLKDMQDALQRGAAVLGDAARRQREIDVERFEIDTKRFLEDAQAEFLGIRRASGFLFVLNEDSGLLAWANPALDITAEVVKRMNQP